MSDEAVVCLVGVAEKDAARELPAHSAMGADRRPSDRSTEHVGVRADPQRPFESRARAYLHPALQHNWSLTYIEDHAGFQDGVVHRDARRVAQHLAARREGIAVAQTRAQVARELTLEPADEIVGSGEHPPRDFGARGVGLRPVPGGARADAPPHGHALAAETERGGGEGRRQAARDERRRPDHCGTRHRVPRAHRRHARLDEPRQVRQGEDRSCLGARERFPPFADQLGAGPQLRDGTGAGERGPGGRRLRAEQVQGVAHSRCTSSLRRSARPVGITSVCPLARTTTMSSTPTTARCSLSDHTTERRTSSPNVTLPTITLPRASGRRTRSNESQEPMSSHWNAPVTTASRLVRSSTATSTATGCAAPKNPATSPADSLGHALLSSRAYAPASPRKRATPHANRPVFQSAPRRRSNAARAALGFSTKRRTARAPPIGLPGTM